MSSTSTQKTKKKSSRQSDAVSDLENVDMIMGNYSRNEVSDEQEESDVDLNLGSNKLDRNTNLLSEDFRSLPNKNSRKNIEMTIETTGMIIDEITNQVNRKLDEIRYG